MMLVIGTLLAPAALLVIVGGEALAFAFLARRWRAVRASRGQASVEAVGLAALLLVLGVGLVGRALVDGRGLRTALGRAAVAQAALGGGDAAAASAEGLRAAALALPGADGPAAVAVALLARGIRETSPNFGPAVAIFTDGNAEPWCADFVSYVLLRAGRPFSGGASGGWRIPWVPDIEAWFRARGRWFDRGFRRAAPRRRRELLLGPHGHRRRGPRSARS